MTGLRPAVLGAALLAALTACGGSGLDQPPVSAFNPGICHDTAREVLTAQRLAHEVTSGDKQAPAARTELTEAQDGLRAARASASGGDLLTDLITAIGYFRLHLDQHTYTDQEVRDLATAARAVVQQCTTDPQ